MKKINKSIKLIALLIACLAIPSLAGAQVVQNMYFNADWQVNSPFSQSFSDKTSGWGAHFEGGYYATPNFSVGLFLSYHTNNKYIERETLPVDGTSAITGDQQHSIFQLPFGAAFRYSFNRASLFEPYIGVELGASYSEMSTYMNTFKIYDRNWGFLVGPELGMNIFFSSERRFGIHAAIYYNYATNKGEVLSYKVDGLNNWGIRLGLAF